MPETYAERVSRIRRAAFRRPKCLIRPTWYQEFIDNPDMFYRTYYIPKTELKKKLAGGMILGYPKSRIPESEMSQWRKICAPTEPLKEVQKAITFALYNRSPSPFDYCVRGRNRYQAMKPHAGKKILIAMDIKNAFPSVTAQMVIDTLDDENFCAEDIEFISTIAMHHGCLPQGSPSSPALLNLVRKVLDYRLAGYAKSRFANSDLTVYVDNYFLSSDSPNMNKAIPALKEIAKNEKLAFNNKKIYVMRPGSRIGGLGLVTSSKTINQSFRLATTTTVQPPKRERDRIRAMLHQAKKRLESGERPQPGFNLMRARGLVETCLGSVYYPRFKEDLLAIHNALATRR